MTSSERLTALAGRYGTPLYVYQLRDVRSAARELRSALPEPSALFYSLKANPHPLVVAELTRQGLRAEISSSGELAVVLSAGVAPQECLYTGPGKTRSEIEYALRAGVRLFSVESEAEQQRLSSVAEKFGIAVSTLVRLNPPAQRGKAGLRMAGAATQFGVCTEDFDSGASLARGTSAVTPRGLHMFSATNVADEESLCEELLVSLRQAAGKLAQTGIDAELLDLGGGFAAPYAAVGQRPRYLRLRPALEEALDEYVPGWRQQTPLPAFESGRYLVACSGELVASVLDVKSVRGTLHVVLDAGTNVLAGMSGTGRILPPGADVQPLTAGGALEKAAVTVVGPLCTPLDVLSRGRPQYVPRVGDLVRVPNVGAYGATASLMGFLSRQPPVEVVLDGDEVVGATRRELVSVALHQL
jgi:diaminopimelate decarboxylase